MKKPQPKPIGSKKPKAPGESSTPMVRPAKAAFSLPVPSILLEGDAPAPPTRAGPGEKFALNAGVPKPPAEAQPQHLPGNYGTGRLTAIARDPYSVFVHWDFSDEQQHYYNSLSADHHLVLRGHFDSGSGSIAAESHVQPGTRHWFLNVPRAGSRYAIELGYYQRDGSWVNVRTSGPVLTAVDRASDDASVQFGRLNEGAVAPLSSALEQSVAHLHLPVPHRAPEFHETIKNPVLPDSPSRSQSHTRWTARKDRALAELISRTIRKEPGAGSLEILELLRRQLEEELVSPEEQMILPGPSSMGAGISSLPGGEQLPSSPYGVERQPPRKTFWFNVNAELIIYGATEPDALVTIGGRRIRLRPDGTFSYRFALPDGAYDLPAVATAGDQSEARQARLRFSRRTEFRGEVGAHPQDQALRTPHADHVA